jgi:hypothetical protein
MIKKIASFCVFALLTACSSAPVQQYPNFKLFLIDLKNNAITMKTHDIIDLSDSDKIVLIKRIKLSHPEFRESMLKFHYYRSADQTFIIFYNWYTNSCELRIKQSSLIPEDSLINIEKLDDVTQILNNSYCNFKPEQN